jgi:FkbM family methyltransferase
MDIKHKIATMKLPIPLPVKGIFMVGPRLGIIKNQSFEPEVTEFLLSRVNENTKFADVGAGYGFHSLIVAKQLSKFGSKVYSFEPSPKDYEYLKFNSRINNLNNVIEIKPFFVSNLSGREQLFNLKNHSSFLEGEGKIINVPTITLDSLNIDFNLVKIDAEGSDLNVLLGSKRLISQGCNFTIEIGEKFLSLPIESTLDQIRSLGLGLFELPLGKRSMTNSEITSRARKCLHINIAAIPNQYF